jgi:hypothetical protein
VRQAAAILSFLANLVSDDCSIGIHGYMHRDLLPTPSMPISSFEHRLRESRHKQNEFVSKILEGL